MNSPAGPGFFANLATKLPFGMSNVSNAMATPTQQPNPNFPSKNQLDPKNNNNQVPNNGDADPNGDPSNNADPTKGQGSGSQLDAFKDIFKLPTDDKGQPVQTADPFAEPLLKLDPKALSEAARKANFTSGIDAELLKTAMSGQDPQAFMSVLNTVAQNGFLGAVHSLSGVVESSIRKNNERFESALPERIRQTQINQAQPKHPALSHPAAAPMVGALKHQIAATNPHLPPEKVAEMAENYFLSFATDVNSHNQQQQQATKPKDPSEVDWSILGTF